MFAQKQIEKFQKQIINILNEICDHSNGHGAKSYDARSDGMLAFNDLVKQLGNKIIQLNTDNIIINYNFDNTQVNSINSFINKIIEYQRENFRMTTNVCIDESSINIKLVLQKFTVGQRIQTGKDIWEVVNPDIDNLSIKVIKTGEHWSTYLDEDKIYTLHKHSFNPSGMTVWEISEDQMKRSSSQALLYWFDDGEPNFELDF